MTADRARRLRSAQRRMLRKILGMSRLLVAPSDQAKENETSSDSTETDDELEEWQEDAEFCLEDWVDWIIRTTHLAEASCVKAKVQDWVQQQRRKYWRWAGHVARRSDGRWSTLLLDWVPVGSRAQGRPRKRWSDDLDEFFRTRHLAGRGAWLAFALDRREWAALEEDFCIREVLQ